MLEKFLLCGVLDCHRIPSRSESEAGGVANGDKVTCSRCGDMFKWASALGWVNTSAEARLRSRVSAQHSARSADFRTKWKIDRGDDEH